MPSGTDLSISSSPWILEAGAERMSAKDRNGVCLSNSVSETEAESVAGQ